MSNRVIPAGSINPNATIAPGVVVIEALTPGIIAGIPTNIVGAVGIANYGPVNSPVSISTPADYATSFGAVLPKLYDMGTFVNVATQQGTVGSYVCVRVTDGTDTAATTRLLDIQTPGATGAILTSFYTGAEANSFQANITAGTSPNSYNLSIGRPGYAAELFTNIDASQGAFWANLINAVNMGQSGIRGPSAYAKAFASDTVNGINVISGGANYTYPPVVTIDPPASGTQATATSVLGFAINSVSITTPGSYQSIPTVGTSGPGSGAVLTPTMKAVTATPVAIGSGYAINDTITFTGGTETTNAIATVISVKLVSLALNAAGTGYKAGDTIILAGGTFSTPAVVTVTTVSGGAITAFTITTPGAYTVAPSSFTQQTTSGSGTGATFQTPAYGVNSVTITTPGSYTALPSNPVAQGTTSGTGTGATFTVLWGILSVAVGSGGAGYTSASQLSVTGSGAGGATGTLTLGTVGAVVAFNMTNHGTGYTAVPNVTLSGGGGTGASGTATLGANNTPAISTQPYQFAGGTSGNSGVTSTTLLGTNGSNPTGMYALANQNTSLFSLVDNSDGTTFTSQNSFASQIASQAILVGPLSQTVAAAIADKNTRGLINNYCVYLVGDWCYFIDTNNGGQTRLISPQGFYGGLMANLSPEQSPLNKNIFGIVATQKTAQQQQYSDADLVNLTLNGIDVISNPIPAGNAFGCETGRSCGLDLTNNFVNIQRMANFLGLSFAKSGVLGAYIGLLNTPTNRDSARNALDAFLLNLQTNNQIENYKVILDDSNNPNSSVILGFMKASVQVQLFSVIVVFLIDLEVGTVTIQS